LTHVRRALQRIAGAMTDPRRHDCEALLASADWVRALARQLLADAQAAEDLAQDALAAALVRPPPLDRPLRGWLAGVVRNLVRQGKRDAGNRRARECEVARAEAQDSAELLERLDSHRAVVEAVARLDEPYRAAILMRYFEGLTPSAIARRTGTPVRTVHTRLQRALARLRSELDRASGGDRRAWLLALIPYARGPGGWPAAATGALLMETKVKLVVAALAAVGVCSTLVLWKSAASAGPPPPVGVEGLLASERPRAPEAADALVDAPADAERRELKKPTAADAVASAPAAAPKLVGRVLDVERAPVAGIRVRYSAREHGGNVEALTDAAGAFALDRPEHGGTLDVASPGWTSLLRTAFQDAPGERELVLVVARSVTLAGRVADEHGRAIETASVAVPLPFGFRARFDAILDGASTIERSATSGPDGRFELADVPVVPGVELVTTRAGFLEDRRALPAFDELALEIVLCRAEQGPERLLGIVLDPAGEPVEGAWVGVGDSTTRSEAGGSFALELGSAAEDAPPVRILRAVKQGYLPAELWLAPGDAWPAPLVLALGPPPLTLAGRVVDSFGEPVPGAEVWTEDEEHFGYIPLGDGETSVRVGASIEGILRGDPWTHRARADAAGRFALTGLLARDYVLRAFDRTSLALATETVASGARDVELRMPEEELHALVAGRVTSLAGEPLSGLDVVLERSPLGGGPANLLASRAVRTDAEGRFAFEHVSRRVNAIQAQGPELGLGGFRRLLAPSDDLAHLELAVPLRVHVQIDAGESEAIERAALLDEHGAKLTLSVDHGEHAYAMDEITLEHGRSEAFSVSELATTLVLYAKNTELRRLPVTLRRGELNTLRL
jgi:RNA polymerase sigma-70 factor (ECF subfamily)